MLAPMFSQEEARIDIVLLERVAAGDAGALGELYDRHSRLLFGLIVRTLSDHAEAEEVLQDVFVQAWTHAYSYDPKLGSPAGWLLGIARNRAIDRLRSRARQMRVAESVAPPLPMETPEALASLTERQGGVHRALLALPAEQRDLIERAYFRGATQSELAAQLNLPLGTVKTRMRSGLRTLRGLVQGVGIEQ